MDFLINVAVRPNRIATGINWIGANSIPGIATLSDEETGKLLIDLRTELARFETGYNAPDLDAIQIIGDLPRDDSLTQLAFTNHLLRLRLARVLVEQTVWRYSR